MTEPEENLLDMFNRVDTDKVGGVLKELDKYNKILEKISGITMRLDRIGVLPAILRIAGQKTGIENLDAPLPQKSPLSIDASSPTHLLMFRELNQQPEENIIAMFKEAIVAEVKQKKQQQAVAGGGKKKK